MGTVQALDTQQADRPKGLASGPSWRAAEFVLSPLRAMKRILYPPACLVCDSDLDDPSERFCASCLDEMISVDGPMCPRCAASVGAYSNVTDGCLECRRKGHRFDAAVRLGIYADKLRGVCLAFKSIRNELLGQALAELFQRYQGKALRELGADVVVAVPLHFVRRWERGFNQAESLAEHLASALKAPHRSRILRRVRKTRPQSELKRDERHENVRGAFRAKRTSELRGATVLLVDDILTTGATCSDAARALKAAGAARVVVAVIARSQEHGSV